MNNVRSEDLKNIFVNDTPLIDVRAPVEFAQGHLPGAVNMPILNDEERAAVGTTYKQEGNEAAVRLGHQLVSGTVKDTRVAQWKEFIERYPQTVIYCFRGGQRSQITQRWLKEAGVERPLLLGGYKKARQFLMNELERFCREHPFLVLSGPTGSGKTALLKKVAAFRPAVDLEGLAQHRGSAFGSTGVEQPSQVNYENALTVALLKLEDKLGLGLRLIVEDESRLIGRIHQPLPFFLRLRESEVVWIDEPLKTRVANIFNDYITNTAIGIAFEQAPRCAEEEGIFHTQALALFDKYKRSVHAISRKLGGLRAQEVLQDITQAERDFLDMKSLEANKVWIEKLLVYYYDPLYLSSLERRQVKVQFRGTAAAAEEFLKNLKS